MHYKMTSETKSKGPTIGIDLGTGYSVVSTFRNGKVEVIANEQGSRITPSAVSFTDEERLIGEGAKNLMAMNPRNTIFAAKRLIGRNFSDPKIQDDMKHWPFQVVDDGKDKPLIKVSYKGEEKRFRPEEISAMVLFKMKEIAESYLGESVKNAVITVPAYFNDAQRNATKDAAIIAGLNPLRIINEPTAAAIAYGLDQKKKYAASERGSASRGEHKILVADYGSGTSDITVMNVDAESGVLEVISTNGDTHLGGDDIDNLLLEHFANEFKTKYRKDLRDSPRSMARLLKKCEQVKRILSSSHSAPVEIDALYDGIDFTSSITRAKYESICVSIFRRFIAPIDDALTKAKCAKSDISQVLLVGGSSRIPKVVEMLKTYFDGKEPSRELNADECVSMGAAILAFQLGGGKHDESSDILVVDICPLSLGVKVGGDTMEVIIERGSRIPKSASKTFTTASNNQSVVEIDIYEGERALVRDNNRLGRFQLSGIAPAPRGVPQIEVTFNLNASSQLTVSAVDKSSGGKNELEIKNAERLSKSQIDKMIADAEKFKAEDATHRERISARNNYEGTLNAFKNECKTAEEKKYAEDCQLWLDSSDRITKAEYEGKLEELKKFITSRVPKEPSGPKEPSVPKGPSVDELD